MKMLFATLIVVAQICFVNWPAGSFATTHIVNDSFAWPYWKNWSTGKSALSDKIKANSMWFNCKSQFTDLGSILEPQTYYSYPLKIEILFNEMVTGFKFTKAELVIRSGFELMNHVGRYFSFVMTSQKIILSRN